MSTARASAAGAALLALALAWTACGPIRSSSDPFVDAGGREGARAEGRLYRVRLEVVCEGCTVTYSVAGRATSEPATTPVWRRSLDRHPRFPEAIRLVASGNVDRVRIYVNGEIAASAESGFGDDNAVLQVETVIPPPKAPEPDSLSAEGAPLYRSGG